MPVNLEALKKLSAGNSQAVAPFVRAILADRHVERQDPDLARLQTEVAAKVSPHPRVQPSKIESHLVSVAIT